MRAWVREVVAAAAGCAVAKATMRLLKRVSAKGSLSSPFRLRIGDLEIQWDENYGVCQRTGWSIVWDGSFVAELEPDLLRALDLAHPRIVAIQEYRASLRDEDPPASDGHPFEIVSAERPE